MAQNKTTAVLHTSFLPPSKPQPGETKKDLFSETESLIEQSNRRSVQGAKHKMTVILGEAQNASCDCPFIKGLSAGNPVFGLV